MQICANQLSLRRSRWLARLALVLLAQVAGACGGDDGPMALFELPRVGTTPSGFYALPYPNDLRLRSDGTIDLDEHLRPNELIGEYIDTAANKTAGFGTNSAIFVRFDGEIDPLSLPADATASRSESASVYLVDVDVDSPTYGERVPLRFRFEKWAGESIGPFWLACLPVPGFPLRSLTSYALVVTSRVEGAAGGAATRSADMKAVLGDGGSDDDIVRARLTYQPLRDWLDVPGGDERDDVVAAALFTTQDSTAMMARIREVIWRDFPAPVTSELVMTSQNDDVSFYEGLYNAPNFQTGDPPYAHAGGEIVIDEVSGDPVVQRTEALRVSLAVPRGTMPASGWPIVLYAHGTGGNYKSYISNGTHLRLAAQGLASMSIDQPLHGTRTPGGSASEELFFNFTNPIAGRDNVRQAALDDFQLVRLATTMVIGSAITEASDCFFDPDKVMFMGHSQGGITGTVFLPYEPLVKGAVISGAGGDLYQTLLHKEGVAEIVPSVIRDYPLDEFNNLLAIVQMFAESSDPVNYGPLLVADPPAGVLGKDIYMSEGFVDSYTPALTADALGVAMGLSQVAPVLSEVEGFGLRGIDPMTAPVSANLAGNTAVFLQYNAAAGDNGHYVVFDVPAAQRQHAEFLGSLAREGRATLVP